VQAIMRGTGGAVMGVGVGKGENRAVEAVKKACANPLLDKIVIDGATSILMCVTGGESMKLDEINQATTTVYESADPNVNIILGVVLDHNLTDEIKVTIIATGFKEEKSRLSVRTGAAATSREQAPARQTRQSPVTLKEKLESMLAAENQVAEAKKELSRTSEKIAVAPAEEKQQDFVVNFNRPDNPLRHIYPDAPSEESMESEADKTPEEDLEAPAFLRRRKSLFD